jgi:hypothetical protein
MNLVAVALITIGWNMGDRWNGPNLMSKGSVATRTFDFMIGNMFLMCELGGIFCTQNERFIMAFNTLSFRNMAVALNNTKMAFLTGHSSLNILSMVKIPAFDFNISFGFNVARGTTSYSTRKTLPFPFETSFVVMADETVCLMNGKVHSLDELGVTGGASKLHFPS